MADYNLTAKVSADVSDFKKGMDDVKSSLNSTKSIFTGNFLADLASNALSGVFNAIKGGVGMVIDGVGKAAGYVVDTGISFTDTMAEVKAISGATEEQFGDLEAKAKEMGATTKFTATEAGEAFKYMGMAGWKSEEMIAGIDGVMNLAAASGEDLGRTSDIVTDALTAFGLTANDAGHFADVLAAASVNANTNVSMLGESFKYAAPVAGALGMSAEDTSIALGLMANAGIKSSQAGTSLRAGLTNLAKPTKQMQAYMDKYNIALEKNDDGTISLRKTMVSLREKMGNLSESEQAAAASAIFGKNAMSGWLAIVNASDKDFNTLTGAIDECDGVAKDMADTMQDTLGGQMTILQSGIEGFALSIFDNFKDPLKQLATAGQGAVEKLRAGFEQGAVSSNLADSVQGSVDKIITACKSLDLEAIGSTVARVVSSIIDIGGELIANVVKWAASADWKAIGDNIVKTIKDFGNWLINTDWGKIKDEVVGFISGFVKGMGEIDWAAIAEGVAAIAKGIGSLMAFIGKHSETIGAIIGTFEKFSPIVLAIKASAAELSFVMGGWKEWLGSIKGGLEGFAEGAKSAYASLGESAATAWNTAKEKTGETIENIKAGWTDLRERTGEKWTEIREAVTTKASEIKENACSAIEELKANMDGSSTSIRDNMKAKWDEIKKDTGEKVSDMGGKIKEGWEGFKNTIAEKGADIKQASDEKFQEILDFVGEIPGKFKKFCEDSIHNAAEALQSGGADLYSGVTGAFDDAISYITDLPGQAWQWGSDIVSSLVDGIKNAPANIAGAMSGIADTIGSYIHFSEPDEGPLSDFHTYMPDMMKELTAGIYGGIPALRQAALTAADTISGAVHVDMTGGSSQARYSGTGGTTSMNTTNLGGINVTVNGAAGQDVSALADVVAERILAKMQRAVYV